MTNLRNFLFNPTSKKEDAKPVKNKRNEVVEVKTENKSEKNEIQKFATGVESSFKNLFSRSSKKIGVDESNPNINLTKYFNDDNTLGNSVLLMYSPDFQSINIFKSTYPAESEGSVWIREDIDFDTNNLEKDGFIKSEMLNGRILLPTGVGVNDVLRLTKLYMQTLNALYNSHSGGLFDHRIDAELVIRQFGLYGEHRLFQRLSGEKKIIYYDVYMFIRYGLLSILIHRKRYDGAYMVFMDIIFNHGHVLPENMSSVLTKYDKEHVKKGFEDICDTIAEDEHIQERLEFMGILLPKHVIEDVDDHSPKDMKWNMYETCWKVEKTTDKRIVINCNYVNYEDDGLSMFDIRVMIRNENNPYQKMFISGMNESNIVNYLTMLFQVYLGTDKKFSILESYDAFRKTKRNLKEQTHDSSDNIIVETDSDSSSDDSDVEESV